MSRKTFKILSIDGGGIKGLYSSKMLEYLEKEHGHISDYFDLLCGTSTGGLIALGLSLKIPVSEITNFYIKKGPLIFPSENKYVGLIKQALFNGKYKQKPLLDALKEVFEDDERIKESYNLLCIPSYSITHARPWVFKWDHPEGKLSRDNDTRYVDVALATSAAPTFLPMAQLEKYKNKQFIDGGVWANNPALTGILEALDYFVGEGKEYDQIEILSIGNLNPPSGKPTGLKNERSFWDWKNELFETSMIGQSRFTEEFLSRINNIGNIPIKYHRIESSSNLSEDQANHIGMDIATDKAIEILLGLADDKGVLIEKDLKVQDFFKTNKTYKTN